MTQRILRGAMLAVLMMSTALATAPPAHAKGRRDPNHVARAAARRPVRRSRRRGRLGEGAVAVQSVEPSPDPLQTAETAAAAYWGQPACGTPTVDATTTLPESEEGMSFPADCRMEIAPSVVQRASQGPRQYFELCRVVAHEWGHEVLGVNYFAASNPFDPAHSPDMGNLMYAYLGTTTPECLASMPSNAWVGGRHYSVHATLGKRDICLVTGHALDRRKRRSFFEAWPCPVTNTVSQDPAPESQAQLTELLSALAAHAY